MFKQKLSIRSLFASAPLTSLRVACNRIAQTDMERSGFVSYKRKWIYIAPLLYYLTLKALRYGSHSVTCKLHRTCLYLVSIHQMAHPQTEVADI